MEKSDFLSERSILSQIDYNSSLDRDNYYPVVYGIDENCIIPAGVSILSLINNTKKKLHFHIITDCCDEEKYRDIFSIFNNTPHRLTITTINVTNLAHLPTTSVFPHSIYYRLLAPYIVNKNDFLLYLDADIVAIKSIDSLLDEMKPLDNICAVVEDFYYNVNVSKEHPKGYFNSGMIYINKERWIKEDISQKTIDLLCARGEDFKYFDQDALNIILFKKAKIIENKFNMQIMAGHKSYEFNKCVPDDAILLHYVGQDKPWMLWNKQKISNCFNYYLSLSPWKNMTLALPACSADMKKYYKCLWHKKSYLTSFIWYVKFHFSRSIKGI